MRCEDNKKAWLISALTHLCLTWAIHKERKRNLVVWWDPGPKSLIWVNSGKVVYFFFHLVIKSLCHALKTYWYCKFSRLCRAKRWYVVQKKEKKTEKNYSAVQLFVLMCMNVHVPRDSLLSNNTRRPCLRAEGCGVQWKWGIRNKKWEGWMSPWLAWQVGVPCHCETHDGHWNLGGLTARKHKP